MQSDHKHQQSQHSLFENQLKINKLAYLLHRNRNPPVPFQRSLTKEELAPECALKLTRSETASL